MKTITIELTDLQWKLLESALRDPEEWVKHVALSHAGKSARLIRRAEEERLYADETVTALPGTIDELLENYFAQPGYKTRREILEEEESSGGLGRSGGLGEPTPPQEEPGE